MALERLKRTTRRGFQQQTRETAIAAPVIDERSRLLTSLGKFTTTAQDYAGTQLQQEIESDKITQASRAAEDLLKGAEARQGITPDATKAGQLAYNMIIGKHDTMEAGNQFLEWYQTNPDADEDTIAAQKEALYKPLLTKYGTNQQTLKAISLQVQNSQFSIAQAQSTISQKHKSKKADEALQISIGDLMADPNADVEHIIEEEIPTRARVLGKGEFEYKAQLIKQAELSAKKGDNRLLSALQSKPWAKNNPSLEVAQRSYDGFRAKQDATIIGNAMSSIETQAVSGEVSWPVTERKINELNDRYPGTYSAVKVAALKNKRTAAIAKANTMVEIGKDSHLAITDENQVPLAINSKYSKKEKDDYIKSLESSWADKAKSLVAEGNDEANVSSTILKEKLDWSRANRLVIPSVKQSLDGLIDMNPDEFAESDLPAYATSGLDILQRMDDTSLAMYFPSNDKMTMALNVKSGMKNRSPFSAFKRAYNIRRNPFNISSEQRTEQREEATAAVDSELVAKWYQFGQDDVPEWQRVQIANRVGDNAQTYLYNGGMDVEQNAQTAARTHLVDYSQTFNHTLINKPKSTLAKSLDVPTDDVDGYFRNFTASIMSNLQQEDPSVTENDIQFLMNDNGTTFTIRNKDNEQLGGRFLISDLKRVGEAGLQEELEQLRIESVQERDARLADELQQREDAAHMALFYSTWNKNRS